MARILTVDDDTNILALIKKALEKDNHIVSTLSEPSQIFDLQLGMYDLILLDVMMPNIDGFTLCNKIRCKTDCPILFLSAKTMENDIMQGLDVGGDDYILKPFGIGELRARVNAHLRREGRERRNIFNIGDVCIDISGKKLAVHNEELTLTKSEYEICEFLACNHGQVFSKEKIYEEVFGTYGEGESSAIAEHIKNIRGKFMKFNISPIETIWGLGYKWK
ncbi:response regulator transcription factor [Clostridium beijerinckii]|uniref:response regulator transcription factor n=1 Tax=Clostridium beijerinckii TaxID=1520 RepID=UPI00047CBE05|nr:response regulator transcription factor [Clostridium beijerinckii]